MFCRRSKIQIPFLAFFLVLVILNIGDIPKANATPLSFCRSFLRTLAGKEARFPGLFEIKETYSRGIPAIRESSRDKYGLITVGRIYPGTWGSSHHSPGAQDNMGNPQWVLFAFGLEAAKWMGVRMVDERTMTIFDGMRAKNVVTELNNQMVKMNLDPLPVQFYQAPPDQQLQELVPYLTLFSDSGLLPFSGDFNALVHDFSFHFSSIITPPVVIKLMRIQTQFLLKFVEHLSSISFETQAQIDHIKRIENLLLTAQGRNIDAATALFPRLLNGDSPSFSADIIGNQYGPNYSDGKTSREHIGMLINFVTKDWPSTSSKQDIEAISRRLDEELKTFSNLHQNDSEFNFSFDPYTAELPATLARRRDDVLRAIKEISRNK